MDRRSIGLEQNGDFDQSEKTPPDHTHARQGDQKMSGGSDTIVRDVSEDENDEVIVQKESPRRWKQNIRHTQTPNTQKTSDTRIVLWRM